MTITTKFDRLRLGPAAKPKLIFMFAGLLSLILSVSLWFSGYHDQGIFIGLWVPAIHSLGALVLTNPEGRP